MTRNVSQQEWLFIQIRPPNLKGRYVLELVLYNEKDQNIWDLKVFSPTPFMALAYKKFAVRHAKSEPV